MRPRYILRVVEGYRSPNGWRNAGVTAYVADRLNCHREVVRIRSEDLVGSRAKRSHAEARVLAVNQARAECERLNKRNDELLAMDDA